MRTLALILLAAALAGCASSPDAGDANDQLPIGAGGDDTDTPGGSDPAPGFAPQQGFGEDTNGSLHLVVKFAACEGGFCLDATATNEGLASYYVSDKGAPAHRDHLTRDGETVYPRAPMYYPAIFSVREWQAGEDIQFQFVWDGMLWDSETGEMDPAPQGAYQWTASFDAYGGPDGSDKVTLSVTHTVVIGET